MGIRESWSSMDVTQQAAFVLIGIVIVLVFVEFVTDFSANADHYSTLTAIIGLLLGANHLNTQTKRSVQETSKQSDEDDHAGETITEGETNK